MKVAPSLLAADFANLTKEIEMINQSEADMLHLDIMDGVFVPNISFGFPVIEAVKRICTKPLDVHLMIERPHSYVGQLKEIGIDIMNVHLEACLHLDRMILEITRAGLKPAVTLNPATPVCMLRDVIDQLDMVLLMSVNPGFGGQKFIPNTLNKVRELKELIKEKNSHALIQVDGGVTEETAKQLSEVGCDIVVAGSYVFKSKDPLKAIHTLKYI